MKTHKSIALFLIVLLFIAGCSDDNPTEPTSTDRGQIIETHEIITLTPELLNLYLSQIDLPESIELKYTVSVLRIEYNTIDAAGNTIKASGALAVPQTDMASPLLSIQHGTETSRNNVASVNPTSSIEGIIAIVSAANGVVSCVPDYPGFGVSNTLHPYIHAESLAMSIIDFLRAARNYCDENGILLNDQIFIGGYSEGGYATMATQREIEQYYNNEFSITASAPMAGPYDLLLTTKIILQQNTYDSPTYIAFLLTAYNNIYGWNKLDDIFKAPYAAMMDDLFDGTNSYSEINQQLPTEIARLLKEDFVTSILDESNTEVMNALQENTLLDWNPIAPIRLFHGDSDQTVPYENATRALQVLEERGADIELVTIPGGTHSTAGELSALGMIEWINTFRN